MPRPRRTLLLYLPAAILVGLAAFLASRFWLAPDPGVPSFAPPEAVRLEPVPASTRLDPDAPSLSGRLLGPDDEPVDNALVYVRPRGIPAWTVSGPDGGFELLWPRFVGDGASRPPGEPAPEVVVVAWGRSPAVFSLEAGAGPVVLRLPAPEPAPADLPALETSPLPGLVIRSERRGGQDEPRPPLEYEVVVVPDSPPEVLSAAIERRVRCAEDGSFTFPALGHGFYRARVLPAWAEGGSWPDLTKGEARLFAHPMPGGGGLVLRLSDGSLLGVARDLAGEPIEGALVLLAEAEDPLRLWPPTSSDPDGAFRFDDLPEGGYLLSIQAGEARLVDRRVDVEAGAQTEVELPPLDLRAGR